MEQLALYVPILIPGIIFCAVAAFVYAIALPRETVLLRQIRGDSTVARPTAEGTAPSSPGKVLGNLLSRFGRSAHGVSSPERTKQTQQQLALAGNPIDVHQFMAVRLVAVLLPVGLALLLTVAFPPVNTKALMICAAVAFIGWRLPETWLTRAIKARRKQIQRSLPDAFDLIIVCVEAGHSLEAALTIVSTKLGGVLGEEIERALREISLGKLRRDALKDMADRIQLQELQTFVAAVNQAEQMGVGIAQVLRAHGEAMRVKRRQMAEEEAAKLPVKMLVPLAIFIFPSIMIVIIGPVAINAMAMLNHG